MFIFLVIIRPPLSAQALTPTPTEYVYQGESLQNVAKEVGSFNERSNPRFSENTTDNITGDNADLGKASFEYVKAKASLTTEETTTDKDSFFASIINFFKDLFAGLFIKGNEDAEDFAATSIPLNIARDVIADNQDYSLFTQAESNVLGANASDEAMQYAMCIKKCGVLPLALCPCDNFGGTSPEEPTGSPIPSGPAVTPPTGDLPAVCYERPICNNGVGDCYKDAILGSCWIYTKGFCSVDCLKPFFQDERTAKIASQICNRESGGDPTVINRGCLKPVQSERTQEYSVGLFQFNLWPDDYRPWRCPGTLQNKIGPPPPYSCEEGPNFDTCTVDFQNAKKNIQTAYELYRNRGYKWGDWAAAGACGIQ